MPATNHAGDYKGERPMIIVKTAAQPYGNVDAT
jgi:hypothetical protein